MVELNESKIVEQFQLYKQQYQAVMIQKEQMRLQQLETEKSLEELEASKNEKAYKITGPIMIKKDVEDLKKELKERQEDRLKKTQQEVLGLEQENEKLREEIAYRQTNEYIEQVAREKLRMTKDGEEIIIVPTPLPQQNDLPGKTSGNKNILQIIFDKLKNAIKSKKNRQSDP